MFVPDVYGQRTVMASVSPPYPNTARTLRVFPSGEVSHALFERRRGATSNQLQIAAQDRH